MPQMKMMGESKSGRSYNDKDIGEDGLEEKKGGRGGGLSGRSDAQTEMEWYGDYFVFRLALGWLKLLFVFLFLGGLLIERTTDCCVCLLFC